SSRTVDRARGGVPSWPDRGDRYEMPVLLEPGHRPPDGHHPQEEAGDAPVRVVCPGEEADPGPAPGIEHPGPVATRPRPVADPREGVAARPRLPGMRPPVRRLRGPGPARLPARLRGVPVAPRAAPGAGAEQRDPARGQGAATVRATDAGRAKGRT